MVYCDYEKKTNSTVIYSYGGDTKDVTGLIEFKTDGSGYRVIKEPEKSTVYARSLIRLLGKYKSDFSKGEFREKISYEC